MRPTTALVLAAALGAAFAAPSCGDDTDTETTPEPEPEVTVTPAPFGEPFDDLAEWHLFADLAAQKPAKRVIPYDVIAPLFSDYTTKTRFLYVPEGKTIQYSAEGDWEFPEGSILVKTFAYADDLRDPSGPSRVMETRLLYKEPEGWVPHTYVWNEAQTAAERTVAGKFLGVDFIGLDGESMHNDYRVPNTNECKDCHHNDVDGDPIVVSLGPKTRQLDRELDFGEGLENQIDHLASIGFLDIEPPPPAERERLVDPYSGEGDVSLRARSYFDANCSGCHHLGGSAGVQSALLLDFHATEPSQADPSDYGVCKRPTSPGGATCGNEFDVVPGDPDASILICRMSATEPEVRMPPLGSRIVHEEGLTLLREWIDSLEDADCN